MEQYEKFFNCPHCGEIISVLLDLSTPDQEYIEDCEVCCHPIEITYEIGADGEIEFEVGQS